MKVKDYMEWNDDQFVGSPIFIRHLHKSEENHLFCLLDVLRQLPTPKVGREGGGGREDFGLPLRMVSYLLSSFYLAMSNHSTERQNGLPDEIEGSSEGFSFWVVTASRQYSCYGQSLPAQCPSPLSFSQGIGGSSSSHLCNNSSYLELVS